jgi:hypothetical protein
MGTGYDIIRKGKEIKGNLKRLSAKRFLKF